MAGKARVGLGSFHWGCILLPIAFREYVASHSLITTDVRVLLIMIREKKESLHYNTSHAYLLYPF